MSQQDKICKLFFKIFSLFKYINVWIEKNFTEVNFLKIFIYYIWRSGKLWMLNHTFYIMLNQKSLKWYFFCVYKFSLNHNFNRLSFVIPLYLYISAMKKSFARCAFILPVFFSRRIFFGRKNYSRSLHVHNNYLHYINKHRKKNNYNIQVLLQICALSTKCSAWWITKKINCSQIEALMGDWNVLIY